jgi:chromosome segregation ATPase
VDALTDRLDAVDANLVQSDERRERLDARVGRVDDRVDTVDDDLADVRTTLDTLERTCEESMTQLAAFASDLEDDVVEIDQWREQVGQAFTATGTAARAPDSIFRADEDEATDSDATGTPSDATDEGGDAGPDTEADGGLDYDPTHGDPEGDANGD